jgi:hypothetical protein
MQSRGSVATSSAGYGSEADLAREIYRASEQEGWSKEKLFKMLADPTKFKKASRFIPSKVGLMVGV